MNQSLNISHSSFWARGELAKIYKYRFVISSYVTINLRMRYRRSVLGFLWTMIAPLLQYLVVAIVFMYALGSRQPDFFPYFFIGSVVFNLFSIVIQRAPTVMLINEMYIKKIYLPKMIYVLSVCGYELTNFFFAAGALWLIGLSLGVVTLSWSLLTIPFALALIVVALIGLTSLLSVAGVYFRDLLYIIPQIMQATFFLTPVIYKLEMFPPEVQQFIYFNPFYHLLEIIRQPVLNGQLATQEHYIFSFIFSIATFLLGYLTIRKFDNRIIFKL